MASHAAVPAQKTARIESRRERRRRRRRRRFGGVTENPLHLPHDVVVEILEKLPVRSLLRFKAVCKSWRDIIESARFARQQLEYSKRRRRQRSTQSSNKTGHGHGDGDQKVFMHVNPPINYSLTSFHEVVISSRTTSIRTLRPPFEMPGRDDRKDHYIDVYSCDDGVLLLTEQRSGVMFLWNPTTDKFREIPKPKADDQHSSSLNSYTVHGFGYDSSSSSINQDYRIVRISRDGQFAAVQVFASKTNSWTALRSLPNRYEIEPEQASSNAFIHGGIHFLAYHLLERKYVMLCLGLDDGEIIREFPPAPPALSPGFRWARFRRGILTAMVQKDRLCLQGIIEYGLVKNSFEIWSMEDYGDSNSWTRVLSVVSYPSNLDQCLPLALTENGDLLVRIVSHLYLHDEVKGKREIDIVQRNCQTAMKKFPLEFIHYASWSLLNYVESLVSP